MIILSHSNGIKNFRLTKIKSGPVYLSILAALFLLTTMWNCKDEVTNPAQIKPDLFNITFIAPGDSTYIDQPIAFSVEVESENPVKDVMFYVDNRQVGVVNEKPYTVSPDLSQWADNEYHSIKCVAEDMNNNAGVGEINCRISDQVLNYINLTEPANNDTVRYGNHVLLKWIYNGKEMFKVQVAEDAGFTKIIQYDSTREHNFTTQSLEQQRYYWRVGFYSSDSLPFSWSNSRYFTIGGPKPPSFVSPGSENVIKYQKEYTFRWKNAQYADQYQFQALDYFTGNIVYDEMTNDTVLSKNLDMYVYKIQARSKNSAGFWGEWSPEIILSNGLFTKGVSVPGTFHVRACLQTSDSGFVVAEYSSVNHETRLIKLNSIAEEEYSSIIPDFMIYEFIATPDNNIVMVGNNSNYAAKAVKADRSFNVLWDYEPVNNDKIYFENITTAQNGGYLLVGLYNEDFVNQENRIYYSELSASGAPLFERQVGDSRSEGYKIEELNGGYLIMAVQTDTIIQSQAIYNLILDHDGNVQSQYKYLEFTGFPGQNYDVTDGIRINNDLYSVGSFGTAYGSFVHKSDIFGTEYWKVNLLNGVPSSASKCVATEEGDVLVGGYEQTLFLYKVSPGGSIIWSLNNNFSNTYCRDLITTPDGGIVILTSSSLNQTQVNLIKLNGDGVMYVGGD